MIKLIDDTGQSLLHLAEIDKDPYLIEFLTPDEHCNFPVMSVRVSTAALVSVEPVRCGEMCSDTDLKHMTSVLHLVQCLDPVRGLSPEVTGYSAIVLGGMCECLLSKLEARGK